MFNKFTFHYFFLYSVLLSPFLLYFTGSSIIAYTPVVSVLFLVIIIEVIYLPSMRLRNWLVVLVWLPYMVWAGYYCLSSPIEGSYFTVYFFVTISLPLIVLCILRLMKVKTISEYKSFIFRIIFLFLLIQLIICLGQVLMLVTGFGLPIKNELYAESFMIMGTFTNSNDLACIVLLISFLFISIEPELEKIKVALIWVMIFLLLILTGSRSAIVLSFLFFIASRKYNLKSLLYVFSGVIISIAIYNYFSTIESNVLVRLFLRLNSISNVLAEGIESDGSMSIRLDSYLYFLNNLDSLGFGSGKIGNYIEFSDGANFKKDLMFFSPHSLVVELGYWLGWFGLLSFIIAILFLLPFSSRKVSVCLLFIISTLITSSVLSSFVFFLFLFLCFFDRNKIIFSSNQTKTKLKLKA